MTTKQKTIIVTGASQGIGAAVANLFLDRGYNVVGNSRKINQRNELQRSDRLALVEGDIGLAATGEMITKGGINAISRSLAMEYAQQGIRVNVVAPGVVDTPLQKNSPKEFLRTLSPLKRHASGFLENPMPKSRVPITIEELDHASTFVYQVMAPTPQYAWPKLRKRVGCTVWVKHENHTPTSAFKVRGGLVYMERLTRSQPGIAGVISATRGNHGQSISFAAARAGIPATIYVPYGNSPDQNTSMDLFGAKVVEFGKDFDEAKHEAIRVAATENLHFVPSFHWDLVAGVASYALELFRAVEKLDAVYVGVGMGSGICALITVRDLLGLKTEIIGVSAVNAPATALSFEAGKPVTTPTARTFADGIATREPVADVVETIRGGASRFVRVSEDEMAEAVRVYYDDTHQVAEGAGAAPLAALLQERGRMAYKNVGVILSGGNIERARFSEVLAGRTPALD